MDKKESKTAEVNGCKSKIGKVRKWKSGGKCRRIRISRARTYDDQESGESFQKLLLSDCANKKREKEKGRAQDRLVASVSAERRKRRGDKEKKFNIIIKQESSCAKTELIANLSPLRSNYTV